MATNKDVNFKVNVDTDDAVSNVNNLEQSIADVSIASLESARSVSEIKKALKEADNIKLSGTLSAAELQKLTAAMGQAKDQIADLREETAALGGTRTEILSANFARLKDAIGNLDLDKFKSALGGIKVGLFGTEGGFKAVGKAIVATGIGALVAVVGLLIANFDKLAGAGGLVGKIFSGVGVIIKSVTKFFTDLTDAIGLTSIATNEAAAAQRDYNNAVKEGATNLNTLYIKGLRGRARETAELNKQITDDLKANQDKQNEIAAKAAEEKRALSKEELRRLEDLKKESLQIYENGELAQRELNQKFADEDEEKRKKDLAASEKRAKERADKEAENEANIAKWKKEAEDKIKAQNAKEAEEQAAKNDTRKDIINRYLPDPIELKKKQDEIAEKQKEAAEKQKAIDEATLANKESIKNSSITILDEIGTAMGKQEEIGKVTALADIAFSTGTALSKALAVSQSPTPDNVASGGIAGIAKYVALAAMITVNSIKAVNIVRSKKVSSGDVGSVSGGNSGRMPTVTQLPQFNNDMSNLGNSRLNPNQIQTQTKVVITQREITDNQKVEINQKELSRLG